MHISENGGIQKNRPAAFWNIYQIIFLEYQIVFQEGVTQSIRIYGYPIKIVNVV